MTSFKSPPTPENITPRNGHVPGPTAYVNARLIDPAGDLDEVSALLSIGEDIAALGGGLSPSDFPENTQVIDCGGMTLAPGLVDMRVQLRDLGVEHKKTITSGAAAAVAGGITTLACLPDTQPVIDSVSLVGFIERRAREIGLANIHPYGAITKGFLGEEMTEMGLLAEAGAIAFTDGTKAVADALTMRRVLSYATAFDLLIVQHPEEPSLAADGVMNEGEISTRLGLKGIPNAAEAILLERDLRLVELTGGRYHAAHISTAEAVDLIRRAKEKGLRVTCDTAPPYFMLNELCVGDYRTFARLSPPLRREEDRLAVIEGLKDGTIDAIASDHMPRNQDSKRQPFAQAENGAVGVETLLTMALNLTHNGDIALGDILAKMTSAPAKILGLGAGTLAPGSKADLVLFDPNRPWKIDADLLLSKSKNTPFDGMTGEGRVARTVVSGQSVFIAP